MGESRERTANPEKSPRNFGMPQVLKVGVIHRDEDLQIFSDASPQSMPWRFEFFHVNSIGSFPTAPRMDFLAVLFPLEEEGIPPLLATLFPGAELIAYHNALRSTGDTPLKRADGMLVLQVPMAFQVAQHLLESKSLLKSGQRELLQQRGRSEQLQEFFEAFVAVVESSWDATERKLGMNLLINKVLTHIHAEECVIYLYGEGGAGLQRVYCTGNIRDIDLFDFHANGSIVEGVAKGGAPYVNNNYSFDLKVPFSKENVLINSILCYPLQRRGERIGVIELINKRPGGFTQEDQHLVQSLIDPLTVAIRTLIMFENAERLTITDDLTKLYNYRYLMQFLDAEVKRCLRYKKKVSLLFIDIDGFKRINDAFGHVVGSQALAELGQVLRQILRETDVVGRYGGDEFVIVLPETPLNGAMVIAERIRKKVEDYEFVAQNVTVRLTVSLGVANCPKHTLTADGLIKKADAAMYRAKELSKNSIKVAV
jgi:diguanylate cyclase (GGDEF)-like protein